MSETFSFVTEPSARPTPDKPLVFGVVADMGVSRAARAVMQAMIAHQREQAVQRNLPRGGYDLVLHPGDLSYADGEQSIWDQWATMVEPIAARVPWMIGFGNHEAIHRVAKDAAYVNRFYFPGMTDMSTNETIGHAVNNHLTTSSVLA
jgi:hypothetical protein